VILLLVLVVIDATGDAYRHMGRQYAHHAMEVFQIAGFFLLWALFGFKRVFILLYILGRIWLFDITYNLWCGFNWLYIGESDLGGEGIRWFAHLVKQNYYHFSFMIKFLSLVTWVGVFIKQWRAER